MNAKNIKLIPIEEEEGIHIEIDLTPYLAAAAALFGGLAVFSFIWKKLSK